MIVNLNFVYVFVMALFTDKKNIYATRILFKRHCFFSLYIGIFLIHTHVFVFVKMF